MLNAYLSLFSESCLEIQNKSYFIVPYDKQNHDNVITLLMSKNIWNAFLIFRRESDCVKTYCFGMDTDTPLFSQSCLQNICLLEHFCNYFNEKAKDIIDCTDRKKCGFLEMGLPKNYQDELLFQNTQKFLQETCLENKFLITREKNIQLSKREIECLTYLSLGKSLKEIAIILNLSPRSVEFYLDNIKKKSGLNRGELITNFVRNFAI